MQFNVSTEKWSVTMLLNLLRQFGILYHNEQLTHDKACLDNVFSNIDKVYVSCTPELFHFSEHDGLIFHIVVESSYEPHKISTFAKKRSFSQQNLLNS